MLAQSKKEYLPWERLKNSERQFTIDVLAQSKHYFDDKNDQPADDGRLQTCVLGHGQENGKKWEKFPDGVGASHCTGRSEQIPLF